MPQDAAEAVRWYRLAAEQGVVEAQYNLGLMYDNGTGVPQDSAEAARFYRLAAEQGDSNAQNNLGIIYGKSMTARRMISGLVLKYLNGEDLVIKEG